MIRATIVVPSISRCGGGVSEAVKLLVVALKDQPDIAVEVATLRDKDFDSDIASWQGIKIHAYRFFGPKNFGFSPGLLLHMLRSKSDVAHVHGVWMFHCLAVLIWSVVRNRPYVVTPHGMMERWILTRSPAVKRLVSVLYQNLFLHRASVFHTLTDKEDLDVELMVPGKRSLVIPNFVPLPMLVAAKPSWWKNCFSNKTIYMFFGRIHEKKGWRELCDAWSNICKNDPDFSARSQLLFCGWLDGSSDFQDRIHELQAVHGNVVFAGPQFGEDKQASLKAASVFILPSKSEGLPMVILEAWAAGVPVLMTSACNLPIGIECGAAVQIGESSEAIVDGLKTADSWSFETHEAMARAGKKLICEEFSSESVSMKIRQLYCLALASGSR